MDQTLARRPPFSARSKRAHAPNSPTAIRPSGTFVEPDWRRLPGYADVTEAEWLSAKWQRQHTVKNLDQLQKVFGDLLPAGPRRVDRAGPGRAGHDVDARPAPDAQHDGRERSVGRPDPALHDPGLRRPDAEWPSHPMAERDSLHEADMWAVEGLTHRYPTKVLAELLSTCPQYCGHCTRMDLVGNNVPQVLKHRFEMKQKERYAAILEYLRETPSVRDVVVSGRRHRQPADRAPRGVRRRAASRSRTSETSGSRPRASWACRSTSCRTRSSPGWSGSRARRSIATSTSRSTPTSTTRNSVTPLVAKATKKLHAMGFRDVRNQGVLLRGVNDSPAGAAGSLLHACWTRRRSCRTTSICAT